MLSVAISVKMFHWTASGYLIYTSTSFERFVALAGLPVCGYYFAVSLINVGCDVFFRRQE